MKKRVDIKYDGKIDSKLDITLKLVLELQDYQFVGSGYNLQTDMRDLCFKKVDR